MMNLTSFASFFNTRRGLAAACVAMLLALSTGVVRADFDRQRADQEAARKLAGDLLSSLIDRQLQQLEENRLQKSRLYRDLHEMRERVAELAEKEMAQVVELLTEAGTTSGERRKALLGQARKQMRRVLVRLLAERERIQLRRKHARLMAMIEEVAGEQTRTREATLLLAGATEQNQLTAIGWQKNVGILYGRLIDVLKQASAWAGPLGSSAAEARRTLVRLKLSAEIERATQQLLDSQFTATTETQTRILASLQTVLERLRKINDPFHIRENLAEAITQIIRQQEALRSRVRKVPPSETVTAEHVKAQSDIRKQISTVRSVLHATDKTERLLERALLASDEARMAIFEGERPHAANQQGRVIGTLSELVRLLEEGQAAAEGQLTAKQHKDRAKALKEVRKKLEKALDEQKKIVREVKKTPKKTAGKQTQVSKDVAKAADEPALTNELSARIDTAAETAKQAADAMKKAAPDAEDQAKKVEKDLRRAIGEVAQAERDETRQALALEAGELNRAAESLARAAAAVRALGEEVKKPKTMTEPEIAEAKDTVQAAKQIARDVAEGVKDTAPHAKRSLEEATRQADQLASRAKAKDAFTQEKNKKPLASQANRTADALEVAAALLRAKMAKTAEQLEKTTEGDLATSEKLGEKLDETLKGDPSAKDLAKSADQMATESPKVSAALDQAADAAAKAQQPPEAKSPDNTAAKPDAAESESEPTDDKPSPSPAEQAATEADRQMQRARVLNEIEKDDLLEKMELARALKLAALEQITSASEINSSREKMEKAMADDAPQAKTPSEKTMAAAQELQEAVDKHAAALDEVGRTTETLTGQRELANQPIRRAVEAAAALPLGPKLPELPEAPEAADAGATDESGEPMASAEISEPTVMPAEPASGEPMAGAPEPGQPGAETPPDGGLVPTQPMNTAKAMAGPMAQAAQAVLQQMAAAGQPGAPEPGQQPGQKPSDPKNGPPANTPPGKQAADERREGDNPQGQLKEGPGKFDKGNTGEKDGQAKNRPGDAEAGKIRANETWFTSLPKPVRDAMKSTGRKEMPRGYERRLKDYFGSMD